MYEVTVIHGAGKGKVMWSGPEIIVMIALGRKKSNAVRVTLRRHSRRRAELLLARQPGTDQPVLHDERQLRCDVDHPPS